MTRTRTRTRTRAASRQTAVPLTKLPVLPALAGIIVLALALGGVYVQGTPLWQAPDEPAHFNYARHIASGNGLPVLQHGDWDQPLLDDLKSQRFPPGRSVEAIRYESHQPPLYYLLGAPVVALQTGQPVAEQARGLRWFSLVWLGLLLATAYAVVRRVAPDSPGLALAVPAFIALVPQHLAISAAVNNDSLAVFLFSLILLALIHRLTSTGGKGWLDRLASAPGLGLLLGLALLTKTTIYAAALLVPIGMLAAFVRGGGRRATLGLLVRDGTIIVGVALLVSGWWFVRNAMTYGGLDITGLMRHDEIVVGQPRTGPLTLGVLRDLVEITFRSFWAQLGWMAAPAEDWVYALLAGLAVAAVLGFGLWLFRSLRERGILADDQGWALGLCAAAAGLIFGEMAGYNLTFFQPQGRYLFYAIVPIAIAFLLGLREIISPRYHRAGAGALLLGMLWLNHYAVTRMLPYLQP